jgi:hypothetical protein
MAHSETYVYITGFSSGVDCVRAVPDQSIATAIAHTITIIFGIRVNILFLQSFLRQSG